MTHHIPIAPEPVAIALPYRRTGGLVSGDQAASLLGRYRDQPISQLARWIVARDIVSFECRGERLVPLFQFQLLDMSPRQCVTDVLSELVDAFEDDLEVAAWFTRPSCWLHDTAPLVMVEVDPSAVLQAARADRYLACARGWKGQRRVLPSAAAKSRAASDWDRTDTEPGRNADDFAWLRTYSWITPTMDAGATQKDLS